MKEIAEGGGEAVIWDARLVDGLSDRAIRALFDGARDADYAAIAEEARALAKTLRGKLAGAARSDAKAQLARLKIRHAQVVAIDFFGANGRENVDGLIAGLESALVDSPDAAKEPSVKTAARTDLKRRVWVTRQGVQVDRMACAWLIRRFIDDQPTFKFVPQRGYVPEAGELRFDMFEAEFTHEGDRCSFEVLLARSGASDPALKAIAEIIHDIDLKDGKFEREEASGIATVLGGIAAASDDDEQRIARAGAIFDDLYTVFQRKRGPARAPGRTPGRTPARGGRR
jgi:hypothetical protein